MIWALILMAPKVFWERREKDEVVDKRCAEMDGSGVWGRGMDTCWADTRRNLGGALVPGSVFCWPAALPAPPG